MEILVVDNFILFPIPLALECDVLIPRNEVRKDSESGEQEEVPVSRNNIERAYSSFAHACNYEELSSVRDESLHDTSEHVEDG